MRMLAPITVLLLLGFSGLAADPATEAGPRLTRYDAAPGSKVTLKGAYGIRDWKAEGTLLCGFLEVATGFLLTSVTSAKGAALPARGEVFIPVQNLKAVGEDWEPYNDQKTGFIHSILHADTHSRISFRLLRLDFREPQPGESVPAFVLVGDLVIAGVTNQVSLPVVVKRLKSGAIQISGKTTIKQSDFQIIPKPTGSRCFAADPDPVEIAFDWLVKETLAK